MVAKLIAATRVTGKAVLGVGEIERECKARPRSQITVDPRDPYREPRAPVHLVVGTSVRAALLHYLTAGLLQTTLLLIVQCSFECIVDSALLIIVIND